MAASMAAVLSLPLASALLTPRVQPAAAAAAVAATAEGIVSEFVAAGALSFLCFSLVVLSLASKRLGGACWRAYERTGGRSHAGRTAGDFWHWA
mmetsp:Transcript_23778/g.64019  ORF Transcript_23778/g.64019 Transcript_23778/m.64019 type:complete len:94 (-) Transcript_23778:98-379(-)